MQGPVRTFIIAAASLGLAAVASAADLPAKAPVAKAPVAVTPTWAGFYLGIAGGYGWGSTRHTNGTNGISSGTNSDLKSGVFGGTYGYNWQWGAVVAGLEGDLSWMHMSTNFADNGSGYCTPGPSCITKVNWLGTDRARLGYAWDRYLAYVTGGVAYGSVEATCCAPATTISDETKTRVGFTVGAGLEAMLVSNLSAKIEYLYVDLGDQTNYHFIPTNNPQTVLFRSSIVRGGLNYRFGGL